MAAPKIKNVGINNMPVDLWERVAERAVKDRRPVKSVVILALEEYLGPPKAMAGVRKRARS